MYFTLFGVLEWNIPNWISAFYPFKSCDVTKHIYGYGTVVVAAWLRYVVLLGLKFD